MENTDYLSDIFNSEDKESLQQYQIQNFKNIPQLLRSFQKDENTKKYPITLDKISEIFQFLKSAFRTFRLNIIYFNKYSNDQLYDIFIDFYINNDYSSDELDDLCLQIIDILVNNIDISKTIIDSIIQKFAKFYYSLEEPKPSYNNKLFDFNVNDPFDIKAIFRMNQMKEEYFIEINIQNKSKYNLSIPDLIIKPKGSNTYLKPVSTLQEMKLNNDGIFSL